MPTPLIPIRPEGFTTKLPQNEQSGLSWFVVSGANRTEVFLKFIRPDLVNVKNRTVLTKTVSEYFASKPVIDYLEAYKETLDDFLQGRKKKQEKEEGSLDEKKSAALNKLVEYVLREANNIDMSDDPKTILDFANRIGLFDVDEEVEELPRRYLPVTPCRTACAYRMFCEENTEDMCQYCKYHAFGEDNGIHYEKDELLNIPLEIAESK